MNPIVHAPSSFIPSAATERANFVLLYDSFSTALRGKAFCDQLSSELGVRFSLDESLWRSDLLAIPMVCREAAAATLEAEFVILSLRGDADLSEGLDRWCGEWMPRARQRDITFVVLFDPATAARTPMESVRCYLRKAACAAGIHFFAFMGIPVDATDRVISHEAEDDEEPLVAMPRSVTPGSARVAGRRTRPADGAILVVDDYPAVCTVVSRNLNAAGHRTLIARDGVEAQKLIEAHAAEIELVVTDIEMPRLRGDDLAMWIRAVHPALPVILMSSAQPTGRGAEGLPYLQKPFSMEELVVAVERTLKPAALV